MKDFKANFGQTAIREKAFEEFKHLPRFLRKMILYSLTKFGILKP